MVNYSCQLMQTSCPVCAQITFPLGPEVSGRCLGCEMAQQMEMEHQDEQVSHDRRVGSTSSCGLQQLGPRPKTNLNFRKTSVSANMLRLAKCRRQENLAKMSSWTGLKCLACMHLLAFNTFLQSHSKFVPNTRTYKKQEKNHSFNKWKISQIEHQC